MVGAMEDVLYIVMPAYNEEQNIRQVVIAWMKLLKNGSKKSRLVVADSGSIDSTHKILLNLKKKYSQLEILENTDKQHGPKVISLYKYALRNNADYVFQTDSDGQTNPEEFISFWEKRKEYDGVIGIRRKRGDGRGRAFVERVVCFLLRLFFGVKVEDANAPFRLMRGELLRKYIDRLPEEYALPNIILTAYFAKNKENIAFEEISFAPRAAGKNSVNFKKIFRIGMRAMVDFWRFRSDMMSGDGRNTRLGCLRGFGVVGCFALVAGLLVMISPAFPWNGGVEMTDSSVFLTVGKQMKAGMVPYVDTFDHKGPLLYIINFIGMIINETKGIFVFEFLAILGTLWFMFKIFQLKNYKNTWFSMVMTILLFTPFVNLYLSDGGNLTEQYAMPFIAFASYVFVRYFIEGKLSKKMVFFVGVSFSCVLMLRMNMVGIWIVFCIAVFARCVLKKEYHRLWGYIVSFFFGSVVVILPIIVWLVSSNAFNAFVETYFLFNLTYLGEKEDSIQSAVLFFMQDILVVTSLCLNIWMIFFRNNKERSLSIWYFVVYVFCILLACMSGRIYSHYGMVLAPFVVFPFAVLCGELNKERAWNGLLGLIIVIMMSLVYKTWLEVAGRSVAALEKRPQNIETINQVDDICRYVDEYTDADDRITVYGNWNYIYLKCNRLPISKYSYQFPIGDVKPEYLEEYYDDLSNSKPKLFVVQAQMVNDILLDYLHAHHYVEKWNSDSGDYDGARIYVLCEDVSIGD